MRRGEGEEEKKRIMRRGEGEEEKEKRRSREEKVGMERESKIKIEKD